MKIDHTTFAALRREYTKNGLLESDVLADPIDQFELWFQEAMNAGVHEANAMTLATASSSGIPSARTVLLKNFDRQGFVFFTNYASRKGRELIENPHAAILFYWMELERQVRIEGRVEKVSVSESEEYFNSRPLDSRIGALASAQSSVIESREALEKRFEELREQFADGDVPLPDYWGGFRIVPERIEFWQGRPGRLHDRISYSRESGEWRTDRLSP